MKILSQEEIQIGHFYSGIGYSGLTDGELVCGILVSVYKPHDHAIIICEKTGIQCAVIYKTLKLLK